MSRKIDENAVAAAQLFLKQGGRKPVEGRRRRRVAFEDAAKSMLRYPEDSEDLKVGIRELKEQLATPEEGLSIMQIAQQARNEKGQEIFENFRQGEEEVRIASLADGTSNWNVWRSWEGDVKP